MSSLIWLEAVGEYDSFVILDKQEEDRSRLQWPGQGGVIQAFWNYQIEE